VLYAGIVLKAVGIALYMEVDSVRMDSVLKALLKWAYNLKMKMQPRNRKMSYKSNVFYFLISKSWLCEKNSM
jgi:hypothetical protein